MLLLVLVLLLLWGGHCVVVVLLVVLRVRVGPAQRAERRGVHGNCRRRGVAV